MGTATIAGLVVLDAEFLIHKGGMGTGHRPLLICKVRRFLIHKGGMGTRSLATGRRSAAQFLIHKGGMGTHLPAGKIIVRQEVSNPQGWDGDFG